MKNKLPIKAVLIDPQAKSVTDIEIVPDFKHYYEVMGVDIIEAVHILPNHTLWVDEEGLLKNNSYFAWDYQQLAGKAILVKGSAGTNSAYTADQIRPLIKFI
jgi:hypothetical protein